MPTLSMMMEVPVSGIAMTGIEVDLCLGYSTKAVEFQLCTHQFSLPCPLIPTQQAL